MPGAGMNAKELLNMDMEQAVQLLLRGWRWWIDELLAMLPPEWRERVTRRSHNIAELRGSAVVYRDEQNGQVLQAKPRGAIKALMPTDEVLIREMELPLLPMSDVRRMIALDIDRLTPFQPDQVFFDAAIVSRDQESGRQQVRLGVALRATVEAFLDSLRAQSLEPAAIGVAARRGYAGHDFDFLAAMHEANGGDAAQRRSLYWWIGAAALLVVNLALLTYRDASSLDTLRQTVETQQGPVGVALRTRERVDREASRRAALLQSRAQSAPLPVLDAVTQAMPQDAWVRRFEWNGRTVHITGARKTSTDIIARLEASPVLRNAHSLTTTTRNDPTAITQQFDLTADREMGAPR
jgi:general secretion pathway protein L